MLVNTQFFFFLQMKGKVVLSNNSLIFLFTWDAFLIFRISFMRHFHLLQQYIAAWPFNMILLEAANINCFYKHWPEQYTPFELRFNSHK